MVLAVRLPLLLDEEDGAGVGATDDDGVASVEGSEMPLSAMAWFSSSESSSSFCSWMILASFSSSAGVRPSNLNFFLPA